MKKMIVLLVMSVIVLTGCNKRTVRDYVRPAAGKSASQIETAILAGCKDRGWVCKKVSDGLIEGSLLKGKFFVEVEIPYKDGELRIVYKRTENLGYKKGKVHKQYYKWLNYLYKSIYAALHNPAKYQ